MGKNWRYSAKTKKHFPSKNKKMSGNIASLLKWRENKNITKVNKPNTYLYINYLYVYNDDIIFGINTILPILKKELYFVI